MAILIIVEDGSNVLNANSYQTVATVRAYALERGVVLSADDDEVAAQLIQSTDYLETKACEYQGSITYPDQSLQWPRTGVYLNCSDTMFPEDSIPKQMLKAQAQLTMAIAEGFVLQPNVSPQDYVTEEKVGPITTKYADPVQVGISPIFTSVDALLAPLFGSCGQVTMSLRTTRV